MIRAIRDVARLTPADVSKASVPIGAGRLGAVPPSAFRGVRWKRAAARPPPE
jgi:hypothetical protein